MNTTTRAQTAVLAYVYDAGHGWLAVSLDEEHGLPRAIDYASSYSMIDITGDNFAGIVYLEEDVDAQKFCERYGIELALVREIELPKDHLLRDLPRGTN